MVFVWLIHSLAPLAGRVMMHFSKTRLASLGQLESPQVPKRLSLRVIHYDADRLQCDASDAFLCIVSNKVVDVFSSFSTRDCHKGASVSVQSEATGSSQKGMRILRGKRGMIRLFSCHSQASAGQNLGSFWRLTLGRAAGSERRGSSTAIVRGR